MAALDVEALLDSTAAEKNGANSSSSPAQVATDGHRDRADRRDRSRRREYSRDRDSDYRKRRERSPLRSRAGSFSSKDGTPARSDAGSFRSRRRSRSRDDRRPGRRHRGDRDRDGDYYRASRRGARSRSRSPNDRRWRRERDDRRDYHDDRQRRRDDDRRRKESTPQLNEDERDRRTVFVQQLAARLRTKDLKTFFEQAGPVSEAQIVKDRVSLRSKGVGYVEFKSEESVQKALQLTGQKLLGIPIIVQLTEAEKNRQVKSAEGTTEPRTAPYHRLYVGNIHFSITETDLQHVFEPFGSLEFVQLQKDENGRSRGYGFVQFREANQAKEALERMNGFDLAGRPIRVGLGNDKFTPDSANGGQQRPQNQNGQYQGSAFSGAGGRGQPANFDRAGGRDTDKTGGASALDDADVAGVNFNNYSRDALMRKLARTDEPSTTSSTAGGRAEATAEKSAATQPILKPKTEPKKLPSNVNVNNMASRCVKLQNMFDPAEEEGESWIQELEDDVRQEAEEKYGHVVHIALEVDSPGYIYLKFDKVQGGENAIKGLNGRYFGGRRITASPVVDAVYSSLFSRTKAM